MKQFTECRTSRLQKLGSRRSLNAKAIADVSSELNTEGIFANLYCNGGVRLPAKLADKINTGTIIK